MFSEKLLALYERRGVKPPKSPKGFSAKLPKHDVDHDPNHGIDGNPENLAFWIKYRDAGGNISERDILIKNVKHAPQGLIIIAICYKRDTLRTFRADRIAEMFWIDTGELVENPTKFLESLCDQSHMAMKRYYDGLMLLTFLARCDGRMLQVELEVMCDYLEQQSLEKIDRSNTLNRLRALYPDRPEVEKALKSLRQWPPADIRSLGNAVRQLVDADGIMHPDEFGELLEISKHLKMA